MIKTAKNWFVPHRGNLHHPYLLRAHGLALAGLGIVLIQLFYNVFVTGQAKVLGYASSISASELYSLTNQERSKRGLSALNLNSALNSAAYSKAQHMLKNNYWAHTAPDGTQPWYFFSQAGYNYEYAGENLAKDFNTSSGVMAGWMGSGGHRNNILSTSYKDVGFAVVNGKLQGSETTLVVAFYGAPVVIAAAPAPAPPPASVESSQPLGNSPVGNEKPKTQKKPAPKVEKPKEQEGRLVNLPSANQVIGQSTPDVKSYSIFRPLSLVKTLDWGDSTTVLLLGTLAFSSGLRHTAVWRLHKKRGIKHVWFRSHPLIQAGLLASAALIVALGSYGVVG